LSELDKTLAQQAASAAQGVVEALYAFDDLFWVGTA
jgi:hypothetical protein